MSAIPDDLPSDILPRPGLWEWVRSHQRAILFGTIVFQMLVLGSMIAQSTWTLVTGETFCCASFRSILAIFFAVNM